MERNADTKWRLARLEKHVIGTAEKNWTDGLVAWRENLDKNIARVKNVIHIWGAAIITALVATGLINQQAAKVIGAFFNALFHGAPQ